MSDLVTVETAGPVLLIGADRPKRRNAWNLEIIADTFDAAQALQVGLVSEVVPTGTQLDRAVQIAEKIASNAPLAVQAALANSRAAERAARDAAAAHVRAAGPGLFTSADAMEAVAAMTEKRAPRFDGA